MPPTAYERDVFKATLERLNSELGIHQTRLKDKDKILGNAQRRVVDAQQTLKAEQEALTRTLRMIEAAPSVISQLEADITSLKDQIKQHTEHADKLAKAQQLASDIQRVLRQLRR